MNPLVMTGLIALSIAATAQYFLGMKKTRWISSSLSKGLEELLKPVTTKYVNIGGAIGYNFEYSLKAPFTKAKGTFTLAPRQSMLYLPVSRLIGVRDRFFLNLYISRPLVGEGHVIEAGHLRRTRIDGIEHMQRKEMVADGRQFVLLWRGDATLVPNLEKVLASLPQPRKLRHFCCFPENKTFFIHTHPENGDVRPELQAVLPLLDPFIKGAHEKAT